ncbi:bifunctional 4'-phosphopantothenoylcysteine decarboxylase/phosphopantothenoylcysteine synthetase [Hahella sp. CCB-MM4]|uniref:bifunctional phosphopantothenoylcysteine decarboxylase/phosphopantothenate--cysteine ligase CoaBC n=1 Tax=Hahella sp. (strain CCB-MM4) TaxID=1926491 RepID=UPI000BD305AD|nr:bifunctional phosphopantothenoylcysteine decarboxylase/phosphopantothenate--cysteine ligase CoaBC [Hahella sp. CCB-MM4]OZG74944.1 bifunctional 4'-phosphopantothenoylcysteine decarboxylase/phosphopantothenoylcysteine synthetase [Hahella sp. CCB-MM4]
MASGAELTGRRVVLVVTGGIAAYKSAELTRLLVKQGAEVQVVMTEGAKAFITPLTFQALSGKPVRDSLLDPAAEMGMGHIELARWGEVILVAPATADVIAKVSAGLADDLFSTIALARRCPLVLAPAMNQAMWSNPVTQANVSRLQKLDSQIHIWGPDDGDQACGDIGPGRMLEPQVICDQMVAFLAEDKPLHGKRVVITAGPTRERIDPVRFISNDSSGKMGYALAQAFVNCGAEVVLVSGPVNINTPAGVELHGVESAAEMLESATQAVAEGCDIFVATAAVADYRPASAAEQKVKKSADAMTIELVKNPDILSEVAALEHPPFCVGFAAETQKVVEYAQQKLSRKKLKMVIANDVSRSDIGFNSDHNAVTIVTHDKVEPVPKLNKQDLAEDLVKHIIADYEKTL